MASFILVPSKLTAHTFRVHFDTYLLVGVAEGWYINEVCLVRNRLTADSVVVADIADLATMLYDGSVRSNHILRESAYSRIPRNLEFTISLLPN